MDFFSCIVTKTPLNIFRNYIFVQTFYTFYTFTPQLLYNYKYVSVNVKLYGLKFN
jgi:hypothetical protein